MEHVPNLKRRQYSRPIVMNVKIWKIRIPEKFDVTIPKLD